MTESQLPHSISLVVWKGEVAASADAGVDGTGDGGPTAFSARYNGPPRKALLRLDERFDPRWRLTIDGREADKSDHVVLDGHFNGWFVDLKPGSEIRAGFALEPVLWLVTGCERSDPPGLGGHRLVARQAAPDRSCLIPSRSKKPPPRA